MNCKWWLSLTGMTLVLLLCLTRLSYREDVLDFLPLGEAERERMAEYQELSGMNRLFVIFENTHNLTISQSHDDPKQLIQAAERFVEAVEEADTAGWCEGLQATFDPEGLFKAMDFVYANAPLFLREADYRRMDSLLALPGFIDERLEKDLEALMLPSGSILGENIARDPLGLFAQPFNELQEGSGGEPSFEIYDGYLLLPRPARVVVTLTSPFGSSETDMNARLISMLEDAIGKMQTDFPEIEARVGGGPQIAVGNARQIMHDSILAVSLAAVLVLALLLYAFRSLKSIALIALSVGWGWLFALGGMALVHDSVSVIVVGISSVIIGIAVNYPLHLIAHVQHQPDIRQALREITTPLLVGNITTVGAFLALVPLHSAALRDLGLFASLLLVGTIVFVLVWLPFFLKGQRNLSNSKSSNCESPDLLTRLASIRIERKRWVVVPVALLTLVFGYFSLSVEFDPDLSNINYMTAEQKADMASLERAGLTASTSSMSRFLSPSHEASGAGGNVQKRETAIRRWNEWLERHPQLSGDLNAAAQKHGFADDAFVPFTQMLEQRQEEAGKPEAFDIASMHRSVTETLSDDFNYIGWICSSVVFLFLWLSFRSFKLAVISFVPMAISWIWILGIMSILGIKFNIVNIILATFIFGQGDDYTIFMTEGCVSEYVHKKPILTSYKRSIILSALIMFIGIGTLIFAKHPALHSLAEVTIIGMFSVVLMAYLIPPLLFKWMMKENKS